MKIHLKVHALKIFKYQSSLSHITSSLSIPLSICYVVQDASLSEYQGLKNVFPEACVLMCYFHVTSNVIKKLL